MTGDEAKRLITGYPDHFRQGFDECTSCFGMTWDDDPWSDKSQAYDLGRTLGEALLGSDFDPPQSREGE